MEIKLNFYLVMNALQKYLEDQYSLETNLDPYSENCSIADEIFIEYMELEKVYKKALEAYKSNNWYILYSIATELDLPIQDPTQEQMEWLEDDIRNTLGLIAKISNQIAWVWYTGDGDGRQKTMANYFRQAYNIDHPNL